MRVVLASLLLICASVSVTCAEEPVPPYEISDANAGAAPIADPAVFQAFGGQAGVARIVDRLVDLSLADPEIGPIFEPFDMVRLRRTLKEQVCYVLGGGCAYTGRDMTSVHTDMGVTTKHFARLVEHLRTAMNEADVPFAMQNKLLAKLAPMKRDVVQR